MLPFSDTGKFPMVDAKPVNEAGSGAPVLGNVAPGKNRVLPKIAVNELAAAAQRYGMPTVAGTA